MGDPAAVRLTAPITAWAPQTWLSWLREQDGGGDGVGSQLLPPHPLSLCSPNCKVAGAVLSTRMSRGLDT